VFVLVFQRRRHSSGGPLVGEPTKVQLTQLNVPCDRQASPPEDAGESKPVQNGRV
jgi:hypothetical protein